jgi:class 3 adenylate cyclase
VVESREYRKVVTVLFCDVAGSTALGESVDPEVLRALLGRYFDEMKAIIERHGGSVEKFIGDAVMAVLGVPQVHEDDALRAAERLRAAGRRSLVVGDEFAAAKLLGRAASLAEPGGREGVELLLELATALGDCGELRDAVARQEEAVDLARALGDRVMELRAACELGRFRGVTDPSFTAEQAIDFGKEAVRELEPIGDDETLAAAWALVAMGENVRGPWQGVAAALEHVVEYARWSGNRKRETEALQLLSASIFWGPTPVSIGLPRVEAMVRDAGPTNGWSPGRCGRLSGSTRCKDGSKRHETSSVDHARSWRSSVYPWTSPPLPSGADRRSCWPATGGGRARVQGRV